MMNKPKDEAPPAKKEEEKPKDEAPKKEEEKKSGDEGQALKND